VTPRAALAAFAGALALASGCRQHAGVFHGARTGASGEVSRSLSTRNDSAPVLVALLPDSIRAVSDSGSVIVIRGRHFAADTTRGNEVIIGRLVLRRIIARGDGTQLRVTLPVSWSASEAPATPLRPGSYPVTVRSSAGDSNALTLRILP
jgi:hypothetical protein